MINIVLFGAPGSGKGTQSARIIDQFGLYHISTGEVLREHIARGTELGLTAEKYISKGHLIPDELIIDLIADVIDNDAREAKGVVFDGFPRTIPQAEALKKMLEERGSKVHSVVGLEVPEEELVERMINRGKETGRADDNIETIKNRLEVYRNQTHPLREFYINEGNYLPVNGSGTVEEIFDNIANGIEAATGETRRSRR
ncbi:MAG: adenylate kinase [Bacteroides sp.]|nr:adenylate kinase [Bacteroides sp.]MBD5339630.1 adenylate kinase [Bacteroides sp.]